MNEVISQWILGEVPILNGIVEASGRIHHIRPSEWPHTLPMVLERERESSLADAGELDWTSALPYPPVHDPATGHTAIVGEGGWGSEGFVVLQANAERDSLLWLAYFDFSNPFDEARFENGYLLVINNHDEEWRFDLSKPWEIRITRSGVRRSWRERSQKWMRQIIRGLVESITPFDDLEREHIAATLEWIDSGAPLFRIAKPDTPPQHLVSYFVLVDRVSRRILLVDHINASLWLPTGGHVEPDEQPGETVRRECLEELGITARFLHPDPFFLTVTRTVGATAGHTDVSLWYLLEGDESIELRFDAEEFREVRWFDVAEIPVGRSDPHMGRFVEKLLGMVG